MARTAAAGVLLATFACTDGPDRLAPTEPLLASTGPVLVECPTNESETASDTLDATGGSVKLHAHELRLPLMAISAPELFSLTTPVSNYMELEVRAGGADTFEFLKPVSITIDYSRCTRDNIDKAALTVWQIDPVTKELLEHMGGTDDKASRTITFSTDHLSTFSIAQ